jgi:rhodanese-related sulfurtransferase
MQQGRQIRANELAEWLAAADRNERPRPILLDVREPWELALCRLADSVSVPLAALPSRLPELDPDAVTVVICHHGVRSSQAALFLERNGFSSVFNLAGGIDAWSHEVDPSLPTY